MQEINVYDKYGDIVHSIWQWDLDVLLYINEVFITKAHDVHFFTDRSDKAYVVHSQYVDGVMICKIPNVLIRENRPVIGCVYVIDENERRTQYYFTILVKRKALPSDYVHIGYEETEDYVSVCSIRIECLELQKRVEELYLLIEENSSLAKSYAVGGTGIRNGEDVDNSKYYAQKAVESEAVALSSAERAKESEKIAENAVSLSNNSANVASSFASDAQTSKEEAADSAANAKDSENASSGFAEEANQSKVSAAISESNAKESELAAKQSEETIIGRIDEAETNAILSESWAVGGTEARSDEDINNAKYYSQQASQYNTAANEKATEAKSYAVGGTGSRIDEDTDNAKYYYEQLQTIMGNLTFATDEEAKLFIGY